jgi:hypothetical protein
MIPMKTTACLALPVLGRVAISLPPRRDEPERTTAAHNS